MQESAGLLYLAPKRRAWLRGQQSQAMPGSSVFPGRDAPAGRLVRETPVQRRRR